MTLKVYLSGEIHTDWRERIVAGAEGLDVTFDSPVSLRLSQRRSVRGAPTPSMDRSWLRAPEPLRMGIGAPVVGLNDRDAHERRACVALLLCGADGGAEGQGHCEDD